MNLLLPVLLACSDPKAVVAPDPVDETDCAEAAALVGEPACEHRVADEDAFEALTVPSSAVDQLFVGKYLVPAIDDARLPPVFLYVERFPLHYDFLVTAFPDRFSGLSTADYEKLVLDGDTREFYAGTIAVYIATEGFFYGFTVWDDADDSADTLTLAQATAAWEQLQDRFDVGDLAWVPSSEAQARAAEDWEDAPFEIKGLELVEYEAYNPGEAYGTLRLYTLEELAAASEEGAYGYQDILILEEAPNDLERVVSGIVTGTRQGGLSHLNVRSLSRGTPNCYVIDALEAFAAYEDTLVRLECGESSYSVEPATTADAEAWWESIRPDPVEVCEPELTHEFLTGLLDLDTESSETRAINRCRYGAKGSNLATLYQRIDAKNQFDGFLIPFHYYDQFMRTGTWVVDLGEGEAEYSFADTIRVWHADEAFLGDASLRRQRLAALREAMGLAPVDADFVSALAAEIELVFGSEEVMVRFRSSSNAEDSLEFSGAGLYESESVCVADETDGDSAGPSRCDAETSDERSISDGLRGVWASLWNMQAWDERDWYGIDHEQVAMGILVNDRSALEQANAVAFTGNPTSAGDGRYLINAQEGELEVVAADPGVFPETILVTVEDGEVTEILRVSESSETDEVLSDARVEELAGVLTTASEAFPNDHDVPDGGTLLWDTEWKITSEGRLVIKQIRPYFRSE